MILQEVQRITANLPEQFAEYKQGRPATPNISLIDKTLLLLATKEVGSSFEQLAARYGKNVARAAIEQHAKQAQKPTLTRQQAMMRYKIADREARRNLWHDMKAAGVRMQQHSTADYTRVILAQLELQNEGKNPPTTEVLRAAYPDNPEKAKSIGASRRIVRAKAGYESEVVRKHPVEQAMLAVHGARTMKQRCTSKTFGQAIGISQTLYETYARISNLEARVNTLEQQMQTTKFRESLADAGATSSKEKVLTLYNQTIGPTEISKQLDMPLNTVKAILRRSKNAEY